MGITKIHHICMHPTKERFAEAVRFYTEVLGFTANYCDLESDRPAAMIDAHGVILELFGDGTGEEPIGAIAHVAYYCDDVPAFTAKLRELGYSFTSADGDPVDYQYKDVAPQEMFGGGLCVAFLRGPSNEMIELYQMV